MFIHSQSSQSSYGKHIQETLNYELKLLTMRMSTRVFRGELILFVEVSVLSFENAPCGFEYLNIEKEKLEKMFNGLLGSHF